MRPSQQSVTPLSTRGSYDNKNRVYSSIVLVLPDVVENMPRVALQKQQEVASDNT